MSAFKFEIIYACSKEGCCFAVPKLCSGKHQQLFRVMKWGRSFGCNELDIYIDEFALYQLDNPSQFGRYWFRHLTQGSLSYSKV